MKTFQLLFVTTPRIKYLLLIVCRLRILTFMSSFKRKGAAKQPTTLPGTRSSPASPSTCVTSTGIPSLDDILGGGLPLSCLLLIAAPDLHSSYGDLVLKYFVAQGLRCRHHVYVVADDAEQFVKDIMWAPRSDELSASTPDEDVEKLDRFDSPKIKIAWRYEQMKQFQTTIPSSSNVSFIAVTVLVIKITSISLVFFPLRFSNIRKLNGEFCQDLDLTSRIPVSIVNDALQTQQLCFIPTERTSQERTCTSQVLGHISDILESKRLGQSSPTPVRICIPSLGSPHWGELTDQVSLSRYGCNSDQFA
jgi:elongator complex protein 4